MPVMSSPHSAPEYSLHREAVTAPDVIANVIKKHGCNASMYNYVHVQIIPTSGANPNVAIWWWSEEADLFIQQHTPITYAGVGANTPYEFTVEPKGRIFFVQVAAISAGTVNILTSGFERHQFS